MQIGDQVWTTGCRATNGKPMAWSNNCDGGLPTEVSLPLTLIKDKGFPFQSSWGFYHAVDADGKRCFVRDKDIVVKPENAPPVPLVVEIKTPLVVRTRFNLLEVD